ncbi:YsnF/AvaK domain-containing protein [Lysobacter humi (ex Lee et al. 2017)]
MATTLVGIFDSVNEAERAREYLLREGLASNSVHVTDNSSLMSRSTSMASGGGSENRGGFFSRLFGLGDDDSQTQEYSQALQGGSALLSVVVQDGDDARRVETLMAKAGADQINERGNAQSVGTAGLQSQQARTDTSSRTDTAARSANAGETLQVMEEELQVGKRTVETGGVRIRQHVTERPVHEQIQLCEEHAIVERRPVNRAAAPGEIDALSMQDRELEIHERAEQAVVGKTARVVEEVRVGKEVTGHTETIEDSVRRTDVDVEQLAAQNATRRPDGSLNSQPRR